MSISQLSPDNLQSIKEFASDKIGVHPTAALIKTLDFQVIKNFPRLGNLPWINDCTIIVSSCSDHFIKRGGIDHILTFYHDQFDERNFPQHFSIDFVWDKLLLNDEIQSMASEDLRLYPNGVPKSDQIHGHGWLTH